MPENMNIIGDYQFGFCDWVLPQPGVSSLTLAAEIGYDGVQYMDIGDPKSGYSLNNPVIQQELRETAAKTGVEIQLLMLNSVVKAGLVKCRPETAEGQAGLGNVRTGTDICKAIGIQRLMLLSFFDSEIRNHHDLENTTAFLKAAGSIARDAGIDLIYESFMPLSDTLELYELAGRTFRLCYDIVNPMLYGFGSVLEELPQYLARGMVDCIHLKDMPAAEPGMAILGTGCGLYKECVKILRQSNYKGWLVSENKYFMNNSDRCDARQQMQADLMIMRQDFGPPPFGDMPQDEDLSV